MKILVILCCLLVKAVTVSALDLFPPNGNSFWCGPNKLFVEQGSNAHFTFGTNLKNIIYSINISSAEIPTTALSWTHIETSSFSTVELLILTADLDTGRYIILSSFYCAITLPYSISCTLYVVPKGTLIDTLSWRSKELKILSPTEALHLNSGISKDKNNTIIGFSYDTTKANPYTKTRFEKGQFIRTEISPYEMTFLHDNHGNFWHNADTGLLRYNGTTTDFFPFPAGVKRKIRSVALDKSGQPVVFTPASSTLEFGNELYHISGNELQRIFTVKEDVYYQYDNFDFGVVAVDSSNNFWTNATARGVFRQDNAANLRYFSRKNADPIGETTLVQCDKKGNVWFAAGPDSTSVLSAFDGKYWWFIPGNRNELKNIIALDFDSEGRIWCGTKGAGLWRYEGVSWKQYSLSNSLLPSNEVTKVLVDNNDNVWAVTPSGIVVFNPNGLKGMTPPASSGETPEVAPAFAVSPQPANETVTVQWGNPADELLLYDAFGRAALRLPLAAETSRTFSVSGLMNGVYFCRVGNIGGAIVVAKH